MLCTLIKTAQRMYRLTKKVYLVFRFYSKVSIIIDMLLALLFIVLVVPHSKIMVQSKAKGIISNQRFVSRPSASSVGNAVPSRSHNRGYICRLFYLVRKMNFPGIRCIY